MNLLLTSGTSLALIISFGTSAADIETTKIVMGDGQINGRAIEPYEARWRQCNRLVEAWVRYGAVIERATEVE